MRRRTALSAALAATVAASALALPGLSAAGRDAVKVGAQLKGKNEQPGPGDPDGEGKIALFLKASKNRACFDLRIELLDPVTVARVHEGSPAEQGPVKLVLFRARDGVDGTGRYKGCVKRVRKSLLRSIGSDPGDYYVNLYTNTYPQGAARGQLKPRG